MIFDFLIATLFMVAALMFGEGLWRLAEWITQR